MTQGTPLGAHLGSSLLETQVCRTLVPNSSSKKVLNNYISLVEYVSPKYFLKLCYLTKKAVKLVGFYVLLIYNT